MDSRLGFLDLKTSIAISSCLNSPVTKLWNGEFGKSVQSACLGLIPKAPTAHELCPGDHRWHPSLGGIGLLSLVLRASCVRWWRWCSACRRCWWQSCDPWFMGEEPQGQRPRVGAGIEGWALLPHLHSWQHQGLCTLVRVHSPWLRRALEQGCQQVLLPLPRIPVRWERQGGAWPCPTFLGLGSHHHPGGQVGFEPMDWAGLPHWPWPLVEVSSETILQPSDSLALPVCRSEQS